MVPCGVQSTLKYLALQNVDEIVNIELKYTSITLPKYNICKQLRSAHVRIEPRELYNQHTLSITDCFSTTFVVTNTC